MPYLQDPTHRDRLILGEDLPQNGGDLNFMICDLVESFLYRKGLTYANINECAGAIECAKLEIYRRIAAPYENGKATQNGDVFRGLVSGL